MTETNGFCKKHAGFEEAIEHIKRTQLDRNDTVSKMWAAIEEKVSAKAFLSILAIAVTVLGIVIGVMSYSQDRVLASLQSTMEHAQKNQETTLCKLSDMKVDIEIIKQQFRSQKMDRDQRDEQSRVGSNN